MLLAPAVMLLGMVASGGSPDTTAQREQCEHELALVQHFRRHVVAPADGLALAADRRDLERRGPGAAAPTLSGTAGSDAALLEQLSVVADLWYARIIERSPFRLMPRERMARLEQAQHAIGQLQSRAAPSDHDRFLLDMQTEVTALMRLVSGGGGSMEGDIDLALTIADQAAAGRPVLAYGSPGSTPPPGTELGSLTPTTDTLPAGYANYAPQTAESATNSPAGCQLLRLTAGAQSSTGGMMRAVECWSNLRSWPGWVAQVIESLDWVETYARLDRDCSALGEVIDRGRQYGRPLTPGIGPQDVNAVTERARLDRQMLRAANRCRSGQ